MSIEFQKQAAGGDGFLAQFPSMCVCGSQTAPIVDTFIEKPGYGHVYLCRLCVSRAARVLGLIKGDEHTKIANVADLLEQAQRDVDERQQVIERLTKSSAERDGKILSLQGYIETLQGEVTQMRHLASLVATSAREMVEV